MTSGNAGTATTIAEHRQETVIGAVALAAVAKRGAAGPRQTGTAVCLLSSQHHIVAADGGEQVLPRQRVLSP